MRITHSSHSTEPGELEGVPVTLATYTHRERHIYGSSRLGMDTLSVELIASVFVSPSADGTVHTTNADDRVYELTNHLGNVLSTFTARKLPVEDNGVFTGFSPHVTSLTDYYPFGSGMEGRTVDGSYRYGFNTQEKDDEIYGKGNSYSAEFWQYDARLARRWNVDPIYKAFEAPYATFGSNPIVFVDPKGDDWFLGDDGSIFWNNSRAETIALDNGSYVNIGEEIVFHFDSYIHKSNDIPVPRTHGSKLYTTFSLKGVYDGEGKFSHFESSVESSVGKTFGVIRGKKVSGTENSIKRNSDAIWSGDFDLHTSVNEWVEAPALELIAAGGIVDVNQQVSYSVASNGEFTMSIGHGPFPSLDTYLENTGDVPYRFRQHSFHDSKGGAYFNGPMVELTRLQSRRENIKHSAYRAPYVSFSGYSTDTEFLDTYDHEPKSE